jgi:nitrate reductase gamma subunit
MGILLTLTTYIVLATFLGASFSRFVTLWRAAKTVQKLAPPSIRLSPLSVLKTVGDIFFLIRLLKTNDRLWIGEWVFHCSFYLVVLRHLRYLLTPVPGWVWFIQPFGVVAGYLLPLSLIYILAMKIGREKGYFPSYNFFLLVLLFAMAVTGLLMQAIFKSDIVAIKGFMSGIFTFSPSATADGLLFVVHFSLFLVMMVCLPAHIFTAPFVIMEARRREEGLETLVHEK